VTQPIGREAYVKRILDRYRMLPGTLGHVRRTDRRLAGQLHQRGVSMELVEAAFVVATCRRLWRAADAEPLATVRTLHYYLPVLDELSREPPDPDYLRYLEAKLAARTAPGLDTTR
jgi:hypothetical protein